MAATDEVPLLKLLTIGDSGVGKSWLLLRWSGETGKLVKGATSMPTIGIDFKMKSVMIDGKRVKVQVWDTAGQERYRNITKTYYRNAHGVVLVYDITDRTSFNNIRSWIQQIQVHADVNVNKILVGNKCDLIGQRAVTIDEGEALAREYKMAFFETSAFNDINVDEAFMRISKEVFQRLESAPPAPAPIGATKATTTSGFASTSNTKAISSANFTPPPKKSSWCLLL